jgi:hypothetical protein
MSTKQNTMSSTDSRNGVIIRAVDDGEEVNSPVKKLTFWENLKIFFVDQRNFLIRQLDSSHR